MGFLKKFNRKHGLIAMAVSLVLAPAGYTLVHKLQTKVQSVVETEGTKIVNKAVDHAVDKIKTDGVDSVTKALPSAGGKLTYKYTGNYNETVGKAKFTYKITDGVKYGKLDKFGRPTYATIRVTPKLYAKEKKEKREPIKVDPCGWLKKNPKVVIKHKDGSTYKGFMYNRSHMIADSLGGDPIYENLVTGTRPQNVGGRGNDGGMAYLETKIRDYFNRGSKGTVDYEVINVYASDKDKLPVYSICNAKSSDKKIDEQVVVYNSAEGYDIDYRTAQVRKK